ncbi:MAG TPA: S8 family serine peptidase [Saprospiraceae bacterium]|nr:S8 family serine peptidase [Saprospiraceae bacterium]
MAKYLINRDQGPIRLVKSKQLVGIKLAPTRDATAGNPDYVKEELLNHFGGFRLVTLKAEDSSVDEKLDELRRNPEVEVGTHVYFAEGSDTPVVPTGEIAITFEDGVSEEEQKIALEEFALALVERRAPYFIIVKVTADSPNPIKVAQALQASLLVKVADPDLDIVLEEYDLTPDDHLVSQQWQLRNRGFIPGVGVRLRQGADSKVFDAWNKLGNRGASDVTMALIDTGFDLTHPDLKGKVVHPYNLFSRSSFLPQGDTRYTHGTPCASVALASANSSGMVGAAPNARFMPIHGTSFGDRDTEEMFDYCMRNGADIISCSWGTTDPAHRLNYRKEQAIRRAATQGRNGKGCVILFAAGNEGQSYLNFYAAHPDVIAVGAATSQDMHAHYSNQGAEIDVVAPSSGHWPILAGRAWWDEGERGRVGNQRYYIDGISRGNHYKHFGGTSSSTPLVAGICALILSANPDLTASEVKEILTQTADKIGRVADYYRGHSRKYGYGRVNAEKAVAEAIRRRGNRPNQPTVDSSNPLGNTDTSSTDTASDSGLFEVEVSDTVQMGWGVQIGAYSNYGGVMSLVSRLKRTYNQPVHVASVNRGGRVLYLVIVGAFANINDARELQRRLRSEFSGAFIKNLRDV